MLRAVFRLEFIGAIFENRLGLAPERIGLPPLQWGTQEVALWIQFVLNTCKIFLLWEGIFASRQHRDIRRAL